MVYCCLGTFIIVIMFSIFFWFFCIITLMSGTDFGQGLGLGLVAVAGLLLLDCKLC